MLSVMQERTFAMRDLSVAAVQWHTSSFLVSRQDKFLCGHS